MKEDLIKYTINNMKKRFLRNILTITSILIGIAAIFAILSFGSGLTKYTDEIFEEMGTDKLLVQISSIGGPGSSNDYFTSEDIDIVNKRREIDIATGSVVRRVSIKKDIDDKPQVTYIMGIPTKTTEELKLAMETYTFKISEGRNIKDNDKNKVVLGSNFLEEGEIFDKPLKIGDKILINEEEFDVVGFIEELGNPQDDKSIITTNEIAKKITDRNGYDYILVKVRKEENITLVSDRLKEKLRTSRNEEEGKETFFIQSFEDIMNQATSVIAILNGVLVLIAGISVLVASINIINTMYTSVYERIKEIGILKAIGAKNSDVIFIFTLESGVIGFFGGLFGVILGYLIAFIGGEVASLAGYSALQPFFSINLIMGCIIFSTLVGCVAGLFPARNASKVDPVNSLRYE